MADDRPKRDHQQKRVEGKTSALFFVRPLNLLFDEKHCFAFHAAQLMVLFDFLSVFFP